MKKIELLNITFVSPEKLENICTYKTKGFAKGVFYPRNQQELVYIYNFLTCAGIAFKVIGNGSNLLIKDNCNLLFISTKKMADKIKIVDNFAYISSSVNLAKAFNVCARKNLSGFERLACIPATIGGALRMNASAYSASIMDYVEKIKVLKNGKLQFLKKDDILYAHHNTNLSDCLILSAKFKLKEGKYCEIVNEFGKFAKLRGEKQPKGFSCGSVFRNPEGLSAGRLIEACGLKGFCIGGAEISSKHSNFILNKNQASFEDIKSLIELCQKEVYNKFNVFLENEVEIIE